MATKDSSKRTAIWTTLMALCIFVSTLMVVALNMSRKAFIVMLLVYTVACSAYLYALQIINRKKHTDELTYDIATYLNMFNMIFMFTLLILSAFIFYRSKDESSSSSSYSSSNYRPTYRW